MGKFIDFFSGSGGILLVAVFMISGFMFGTFLILLICNKLNTSKTVHQMETLLKATRGNSKK